MRVALISTVQTVTDGDDSDLESRVYRCAFAYIAGQTVAERQVRLALSVGCERIACITDTIPPEVVALQHIAERNGAKFHVVRRARDLAGLIVATDDVLAIADGLFAEPALAERLVAGGRFVAALPVDVALEAGFERIDREWGWAGLMLVPGHLVDPLADLPPDSDPIAALLRIALQSQVKVTPIETALVTEKRLALAVNDESASELEEVWLRSRVDPAGFFAPTKAVTDRIGLRWGGQWLARGVGVFKLALAAFGIAALSAGAAWLFGPVYGFAGAIVAAFVANLAASVLQLDSGDGSERAQGAVLAGARLLIDGVIIGGLTLIGGPEMWQTTLFSGFMLVGLARLSKVEGLGNLASVVTDRIVLLSLIIASVVLGYPVETVQVLALAILGGLFLHNRTSQITQV